MRGRTASMLSAASLGTFAAAFQKSLTSPASARCSAVIKQKPRHRGMGGAKSKFAGLVATPEVALEVYAFRTAMSTVPSVPARSGRGFTPA
jgi:hypothetical protein